MSASESKVQLVMIIEPETKHRFRYSTEGSSHGGIKGKQEGGQKKLYPTVKLEGYHGNKPVYVRVSLYDEDYKPHVLEFIRESEDKDTDKDVDYTPYIIEYIKEDFTATFQTLKFFSKKKDEICRALMDQRMKKIGDKRKSVRTQFEKQYGKEDKEKAKNIMNSVRLCFEAFEEDKPNTCLCEPLFSELICNQKAASKGELRITRMSSCSGSWKGGDDVILLCNKIEKGNIEIHFYETEHGREIWKSKAVFTAADVHYQVAICFKTPKYRENVERRVFVCLARNDEVSEPLEFVYKADPEGNPSKKRKNSQESVAFSESSFASTSSETSNEPFIFKADQSEDDTDNMSVKNVDLESFLRDFGVEMKDLDVEMKDLLDPSGEDYSLPTEDLIYPLDNMPISGEMNPPRKFIHTSGMFILPETIHNQVLQPTYVDPEILVEADGAQMDESSTEVDGCLFKHLRCVNRYKTNEELQKEQKLQKKFNLLLMGRDAKGNTLLHAAISKNQNVELAVYVAQLVTVDMINVKNYYQETALHIAIQRNNLVNIEILLKIGSNPNLKNAEGNNCYHIACLENSECVMLNLLTNVNRVKYPPELTAHNYKGLSPFHIAVMNNSKGCYHLLKSNFIGKSIFKTITDQKTGRSLLHYAAEFQPSFVPVLLKEKDTDVNIQDMEGNTALHIACAKADIKVVKQLLKAGADPRIKNFKQNCNCLKEENLDDHEDEDNIDGETPVDVTTNIEILEILKQATSKTSGREDTDEKFCNILDVNMKWKDIAIYFMEENFIDSLEWDPLGPSKALLQYIKRNNRVEELKTLLEMNALSEGLEIICGKT